VLALIGQAPTTLEERAAFNTPGHNGSRNAEMLFWAVSVCCRRVMKAECLAQAVTGNACHKPSSEHLPKT
jgi:hypothetical protein